MATKKDNPNIFFRQEWWLYLKWRDPSLRDEVLTRFFNHCCGMETIDIDAISSNPTEAEQLLIPMVMQYEQDRASYQSKCDQMKANGSKSHSRKTATPNGSNCYQMVANGTNEVGLVTKENKIKGKERKENDFFIADEETSPEKEKKEILLKTSLYFLSKAVLKPYAEAERAWDYNEAEGWHATNRYGTVKDYSQYKYERLKGWQCEGLCYPLKDAEFFGTFAQQFGLAQPEFIDSFHGLSYTGALVFLFDTTAAVRQFMQHFASDHDLQQSAARYITSQTNLREYRAELYKSV